MEFAQKFNSNIVKQKKTINKNNNIQLKSHSPIQMMSNQPNFFNNNQIQKKENSTNIPDNIKYGVENLSGISLDNVNVHYNSSKPAQLKSFAYTQGNDIHIAPGQEKYLPHEAWHVVQQKQGRVQPTIQEKGLFVNDNTELENEADIMGKKALQMATSNTSNISDIKIANNYVQKKVYQFGRAKDIINEDNNNYVIKINLAGSGDKGWRKARQKPSQRNPNAISFDDILKDNEFIQDIRSHSYEKGTDSDQARNERINTSNATNTENINMYGRKVIGIRNNNYKDNLDFIREKSNGNETTFTLAGPLGNILGLAPGSRDSSDYSIENNITHAIQLVKDKIISISQSNPNLNIYVLIKGHSRGAVAASQVAMGIQALNFRNVKVELVQYDPVPGPSHADLDTDIDFDKNYEKNDTANSGSKNLGVNKSSNDIVLGSLTNSNTTVVYSINSDHQYYFTPQQVMNAKRVILTPFTHAVGLYDTEEDGGKIHKKGFNFGGRKYRGSSLNTLQEGLYFSDLDFNLQKITNVDRACTLLSKYYGEAKDLHNSGEQKGRFNIIKGVIANKLHVNIKTIDSKLVSLQNKFNTYQIKPANILPEHIDEFTPLLSDY